MGAAAGVRREAMALQDANAAFVDEQYALAVELYTKAIEEAPSAQTFLNRGQAYSKLERFADAAADATKACEIDSTSSKAAMRLGIARFAQEECPCETSIRVCSCSGHVRQG